MANLFYRFEFRLRKLTQVKNAANHPVQYKKRMHELLKKAKLVQAAYGPQEDIDLKLIIILVNIRPQ